MKKIVDLKTLSEKKLRTLRNNLNNRLESFKKDADSPKPLQASHALYGLSEKECQDLLKQVLELLKS